MPFDGLRVLSLESRRCREMERLIRACGGEPFVAPSMREISLAENSGAFAFAERLFSRQFEMMILLTGVGTRLLAQVIETRYPAGSFASALSGLTTVVRGSKPLAVLREWNVPPSVVVPEPNTWREILSALDGRPERKIAVQEYGRDNPELIDGLRRRGAEVTPVSVYRWDLPEDTAPLRKAVGGLCEGRFDVVLFTTSIQVPHLLKIAAEMGLEEAVRAALKRTVVGSVGPTTSETLADYDLPRDFEPSHPKMGFLVNEISGAAAEILARKR
ncbi:MAG TPA: uroporphyrinogen-III synthase [Bryobacteraceae bacterium]|nr:uroporphyrinogen-III synthase [Bryobacteraceae bacterium]